ncbi:S8/S53 family peptidase [Ramlibacter sp. XY19]|uniref:S8 family peptidase n=1 Tax=Ramlibacter paludis TaxID=2908000 RepID=UPI0023DB55D1|nr:S8/S53 family peptidase [Ramlibacter paludis]MCG2594624.1 S8/S53 family peptidase [Ramlibacter paludis]
MDAFKVILPDNRTFAEYRGKLKALAGESLDVGVEQVGVREGIVRGHVVDYLLQQNPGKSVDDLLVRKAGANRCESITDLEADVLYRQRIAEDLEPREVVAVPAAAGGRAWHLEAVNVRAAWQQVGGPDAIDWGGIRVGQIDTGYTRHAAYGFPNASWIAQADCRTFEPFPITTPGVDPMPFGAVSKGHGTRIGATISGCFDLPDGFRYRGIAPKVPHVVVRITDSVAINTRQAEFIQALDYLVAEAKVSVINISLGMFPPQASPDVRNAMARARSAGVIVVCAAGNGVNEVVVPAALDTAIAVAGTTFQSLPWNGSSFGPQVAFSAPAAGIFRANPQRNGVGKDFADGGDGTSYATAITTGAAALWLLRWGPQIAAMYGPGSARVEAFRQAAMDTARRPPGWQPTPFGAGILDIGVLCTDAARALPTMSLVPVPWAIAATPGAIA